MHPNTRTRYWDLLSKVGPWGPEGLSLSAATPYPILETTPVSPGKTESIPGSVPFTVSASDCPSASLHDLSISSCTEYRSLISLGTKSLVKATAVRSDGDCPKFSKVKSRDILRPFVPPC